MPKTIILTVVVDDDFQLTDAEDDAITTKMLDLFEDHCSCGGSEAGFPDDDHHSFQFGSATIIYHTDEQYVAFVPEVFDAHTDQPISKETDQ